MGILREDCSYTRQRCIYLTAATIQVLECIAAAKISDASSGAHLCFLFSGNAVRILLYIVNLLPLAVLVWNQSPANAWTHPAVARIIVPERGGASLGSGTLVAVNDRHGLVITNWHVVRDGNGLVSVVFPDGFHSGATVLKADRDWDLAALAIWRPHVAPVRLASSVPRKGEQLTIAGYGSGKFRMASGRCTQFVSPGRNLPFEMLELSAQARQGDSGGPILNQRGELAGVLFGAAWGRTAGSHAGRVHKFLASVTGEFRDLPDSRTMIAQRPSPNTPRPAELQLPAGVSRNLQPGNRLQHPTAPEGEMYAFNQESNPPRPESAQNATNQGTAPVAAIASHHTAQPIGRCMDDRGVWRAAAPENEPAPAIGISESETLGWDDIAGGTLPGRIKTFLAIVGLLAIFIQSVRLLGPTS